MAKFSEELQTYIATAKKNMEQTEFVQPLGIVLMVENIRRVFKEYFTDKYDELEDYRTCIPYDH